MANIEVLEERIANLEKQVLGVDKTLSIDDPLPETSVIDGLLHLDNLISPALSCRDQSNALSKRLDELSDYLDPSFEDSDLQTEAKVELILALEPRIRENLRLFTKLEELLPVLETNDLRDVPELTTKLNSLTLFYIEAHNDCEALTAEVREVFSKYNAVITSISKTLITLDAAVTAAEAATKVVKQLD